MAAYPTSELGEPNIYDGGPVATDLRDVLGIARSAGRPLTIDEAETALALVGRNAGPALLFDLLRWRCLTLGALPALLLHVWVAAEGPGRSVPHSVWIDWFRQAAYPPPARPLAIFRGAVPRRARGLSWTTDREQAAWFAGRGDAYLYTATAEPDAVLADVAAILGSDDEGGEREIIVNTRMLGRIRRWEPA